MTCLLFLMGDSKNAFQIPRKYPNRCAVDRDSWRVFFMSHENTENLVQFAPIFHPPPSQCS